MDIIEDKIFLGHTPSDQRKFLTYYLKKLVKKYPKYHNPCVGELSLIKCAIEAGYKPENITCSDISLFSALLGYYFMDEDIDTIGFRIEEPTLLEEYNKAETQEDKLATLLLFIKLSQYREYYYEQLRVEQIIKTKNAYKKQLISTLDTMKQEYKGITYTVEDLRDCIKPYQDTVVVINPPAFSGGYERMFNFEEHIKYDSGIEEFNLSKEFLKMFEDTTHIDTPFIWYKYQNIDEMDSKLAIFAKEYPKGRHDYWLINNRKFYKEKPVLVPRRPTQYKPLKGLKVMTNQKITEKSKIRFIQMKEENALYYRSLFAHKLGETKSEMYVGFTIDGNLFAVSGFMLTSALRLADDSVFEVFGFTAYNPKYPTLNRLLMYLLTAQKTSDYLQNYSNKNRLYQVKQFRTVCLSKYRKVKLNNGILDVKKREKVKNMYKILYTTDFYNRSYEEVLKIWLKETKTK